MPLNRNPHLYFCPIHLMQIGIAAAGSILEASHSWTLIFLIAISCYTMGIVVWAYGMRGRPLAFDEWESEQQRQHAPLASPTTE